MGGRMTIFDTLRYPVPAVWPGNKFLNGWPQDICDYWKNLCSDLNRYTPQSVFCEQIQHRLPLLRQYIINREMDE